MSEESTEDKARAEQIRNNEEKMAYDAKQRSTLTPDEMRAALEGDNVVE